MTNNQIQVAMERFTPYLGNMAGALRSMLKDADECCLEKLMTLKMKKRSTAILFAVFLGAFGAGRFYIGDTKLGILRIAIPFSLSLLCGSFSLISLLFGLVTTGILQTVVLIWHIIDIFSVADKVSLVNYTTLNKFLSSYYSTKR